nr:MAG TPA: hypothetical protein [Bacteriophage sp.]
MNLDVNAINNYSPFGTYYKGSIVKYNEILYICPQDNGYKFNNIRIHRFPEGWRRIRSLLWIGSLQPFRQVMIHTRIRG